MAKGRELERSATPDPGVDLSNPGAYPDWDDFRVLLTVVKMGSFKRAAEALGTRQPTISRKIARLEATIGVTLVERSNNGASLTIEGQRILHELNVVHETLKRAVDRTQVARRDVQNVNLLMTDGFASYWLAHFLEPFFDANPDIALRVLTVNDSHSDKRGHIDLAIHYMPPNDMSTIRLRMGTLHFIPFAARSYLQKHGRPRSLADLSQHRLTDQIFFLVDKGSLATLLPDDTGHDRTLLYANSSPFLAQAMKKGAGIGMLPTYAAVLEDDLEPLEINFRRNIPFWLCYRRESLAKTSVQRTIAFLKHVIDQHSMPWFAERYVPPSKFKQTSVGEIMERYDPVVGTGSFAGRRPDRAKP
jgi:DNA-binding transcriptional LysR family regulator